MAEREVPVVTVNRGVEAVPAVPALGAPDPLRVATRGDLDEIKTDLRREMKLWLGLGVAGGNVLAAVVAGYLGHTPAPVRAALHVIGLS